MMALRTRSAVLLVMMACSPKPDADASTMDETSDGTSGEPTSTATGGATESATTGSSSSGCGETTGMTDGVVCPDECSLAAAVCGLGIGVFEDCGTVDLGDDAAAWQAVHECALAAVSEQRTFLAVTQHFTFDSTSYRAHVGQAGCPYAITMVTFDDDPCGGLGCGPAVRQQTCAGLSVDSSCIGAPDGACLRCESPGETSEVCG
jgi:hypothetical protein